MRLAAFALLGISLAAAAGPIAPLELAPRDIVDVASTRSQVSADGGASPMLHIIRTDDLIDTDKNAILAERISHIVVKVLFDREQNALRIGDSLLPISSGEQPSVAIIKTDALTIPRETATAPISEAEMQALASKMSPGIVSLEVMVESEFVDGPPITGVTINDGMTYRRVAIFAKITEVEGVDFVHSSLIYVPLLQLIAYYDAGGGLIKLKTVADFVQAGGFVQPGHVKIQEIPALVEKEDVQTLPSHRQRRPLTFMGWLANLFGLEADARHHRRPCPKKFKQGLAAAPHADTEDTLAAVPWPADGSDNYLEAMPSANGRQPQSEDEAADIAQGEKSPSPHHHGHRHHRGHGRRKGKFCFVKRTMRKIRHFFEESTVSAISLVYVAAFGSGLLLGRLRRAYVRRRAARQAIALSDDDGEVEVEKKMADHLVYVDELPGYEEVVATPIIVVQQVEQEKV